MPCGEAFLENGAMTCRVHPRSGQREVLPDRAKTREKRVERIKELSKNNFYNFARDLTDDFVDGTDAAGDSV